MQVETSDDSLDIEARFTSGPAPKKKNVPHNSKEGAEL